MDVCRVAELNPNPEIKIPLVGFSNPLYLSNPYFVPIVQPTQVHPHITDQKLEESSLSDHRESRDNERKVEAFESRIDVNHVNSRLASELSDGGEEVRVDDRERLRSGSGGGGVSVTKYNPSWSERFQFLSGVKLESDATCINVLPFEDYEGFSKYVAVGDEHGRVYVLSSNGDVLVEFQTLSKSPIKSMISYMSASKNESVLVTGHGDGVVLVHRIWEASNVEEWHSLSMANVKAFESVGKGEEGSEITILEVHQVGRMRYILSSDARGNIRVLRENGTLYGSVASRSRPLAFLKQRLLFLMESGAGSLDLRSMKIKESECEGLNNSLVRNYVFDVSERSKAYGFTSDGDLIHVMLLGDIMNFKCRVRSKRKFEADDPLVIQAIKGYLLVASKEKVYVYNVSSQHYIRVGTPRPLFFTSLDEIRSSFLNSHELDKGLRSEGVLPFIASDREKLLVLGLGSGCVGIYRSNLPVFNPEFNTMLWITPLLLFFLFLFGVWQFFGKKKESLTSWGSEDPFSSTSVPTGVTTMGSGLGERAFADSSSRTSDLRDQRGGALRGPTRRYGSPTRYTGAAAAIPYRPSTADPNFRTSSTDHNFRPAADLKYRGPSIETSAFPKRRETMFPNSQVQEDNVDNIN
ncbi:hypothetical protein Sjap_004084 [Stephania japonica]|uniref:Uncharacterized protein n=1 Tax=Stephania japonica TaxID=461633 RepID=A0AAP0K1N3_9MAGN